MADVMRRHGIGYGPWSLLSFRIAGKWRLWLCFFDHEVEGSDEVQTLGLDGVP